MIRRYCINQVSCYPCLLIAPRSSWEWYNYVYIITPMFSATLSTFRPSSGAHPSLYQSKSHQIKRRQGSRGADNHSQTHPPMPFAFDQLDSIAVPGWASLGARHVMSWWGAPSSSNSMQTTKCTQVQRRQVATRPSPRPSTVRTEARRRARNACPKQATPRISISSARSGGHCPKREVPSQRVQTTSKVRNRSAAHTRTCAPPKHHSTTNQPTAGIG